MKFVDVLGKLNAYNKILLLLNNSEEIEYRNKYEIPDKYWNSELYCIGVSNDRISVSIWIK